MLKKNNFDIFFYFFPLLIFAFIVGQAAISFVFVLFTFVFIARFKKITFFSEKQDYFLIFFVSILILSSVWNYYNEQKNIKTIFSSILFLKFLIPYFLLRSIQIDNNFYIHLKKILIISSLALIFVVVDIFFQYNDPNKIDLLGYKSTLDNINRLTGPFGNNEGIPGSFLLKVCFVVLVFLAFYLSRNFFTSRKYLFYSIFLTFLILYITSILITGERMSFLSALLVVFIFLVLLFKFRSIPFIFIIFAILLTIFLNLKNPYVQQRYEILAKFLFSKNYLSANTLENSKNNLNNKNSINFFNTQWGAHFITSIEIFKDKPVIGSGIKGFRNDCSKEKYEDIKSLSSFKRCSTHPHNIYLEILSETGLSGFISLIIFFIYIILRNFRNIIRLNFKNLKSNEKIILTIYIASFSVLLSILWPIRSSGSFFSNLNGSMIWINIYWLLLIERYFKKNNMI
tara:strand:+ start:1881 stop:3248 length:1368 start_codon:yes stop_codon:yes gene_type:complete